MMPVEDLHKHSKYWFSDGNVILSAIKSPVAPESPYSSRVPLFPDEDDMVQAQPSEQEERTAEKVEKVLYKLHKSILAKESRVFENMFALPGLHGDTVVGNVISETGEDKDMNIDVPIITMTDESKRLDLLIDVIYNPVSLTRLPQGDAAFQLEPLVRMLHKYQCDTIYSHVIGHVIGEWPSDDREWVNLEKKDLEGKKRLNSEIPNECDPWPAHILPDPASTLRFSIKFGGQRMAKILPAVLYDLARTRFTDDWDAWQHEINPSFFQPKGARWHLLRAEDLLNIGKAKDQLMDLIRCVPTSPEYWHPPFACQKEEHDREALKKIEQEIRDQHFLTGDVLKSVTPLMGRNKTDPLLSKYGLCRNCVRQVDYQLSQVQSEAWWIVRSLAGHYNL